MLNPQVAPDFSDSTLEWRRMFAESWGTFLLVLVAAGGGVGGLCLALHPVVPEPLTMITIAAGVGGLAAYVRKRARKGGGNADQP